MSRASRIASTIARKIGRQAAQPFLVTDRQPDEGTMLDRYLRGLRQYAEREGYSVDSNKCFWCGRRTRLRVGRLPHVGALLVCPVHAPVYQALKTGRPHEGVPQGTPETHKVHLCDGSPWGDPLCGVASEVKLQVTSEPAQVTCLRCKQIMSSRRKLSHK